MHSHYFISGTSKGIGKELALKLLNDQSDCTIYGYSRSSTIQHPAYKHFKTDLSETAFINEFSFKNSAIKEDDKVVLVNNAGLIEPVKYIGEAKPGDIIRHFNVNLLASVLLINKFAEEFATHRGEKLILNISSGAAGRPIDGWSCYCSGKAGLQMYAETFHKESIIRKNNFKIFSIAPGIIDTPMQEKIRESKAADFSQIEQFKQYKAEGALKSPKQSATEIADVIYHPHNYQDVLIAF